MERVKTKAQLKIDNAARRRACQDRKKDLVERTAFWDELNNSIAEADNADFWQQLQPMQAAIRIERFASTCSHTAWREDDLFEDVTAGERDDTGNRVGGLGMPSPPDIHRTADCSAVLNRQKRPPEVSARTRLEALRRRVCNRVAANAGPLA